MSPVNYSDFYQWYGINTGSNLPPLSKHWYLMQSLTLLYILPLFNNFLLMPILERNAGFLLFILITRGVELHASGTPHTCSPCSPKSGRVLCHWLFLQQLNLSDTILNLKGVNLSHAANKISINVTAAGFICKNIFPTPVQVKKKIKSMTYSKYTYIRMFVNKFSAILTNFHSPFH